MFLKFLWVLSLIHGESRFDHVMVIVFGLEVVWGVGKHPSSVFIEFLSDLWPKQRL